MVTGVDATPMKSISPTNSDFPQFPGEDFLAHAAATYKEQVETALAMRELLFVAQGGEHPSVKAIKDVDLTRLPALAPTDRDYNRREETRIKILTQNEANAEKRIALQLKYWTEVYAWFKQSTELSAPVLSRELKDACDLSTRGVEGGFFDGPRAYAIVLHRLANPNRSEADKDFYRAAERVQRGSALADGCQATEFSKKALAFILKIRPYLAQGYSDDDTSQYIIDLMPKALREGGRRIKAELRREGRYHDHMHVVQTCRALVHEEQKAPAPAPALVALAAVDIGCHDLESLSRTTGMMLSCSGRVVGLLKQRALNVSPPRMRLATRGRKPAVHERSERGLEGPDCRACGRCYVRAYGV